MEEELKGDDKEAIEEKTKLLADASSSLAQRLYQEQQTNTSEDNSDSPQDSDDSAVDADFEEVKEENKKLNLFLTSMSKRDYYEVLGVDRSVSKDDLKILSQTSQGNIIQIEILGMKKLLKNSKSFPRHMKFFPMIKKNRPMINLVIRA